MSISHIAVSGYGTWLLCLYILDSQRIICITELGESSSNSGLLHFT